MFWLASLVSAGVAWMVQALEERLRSLVSFLGDYLHRSRSRASRAAHTGGGGAGAGPGANNKRGAGGAAAGQAAAKRPRLEEATKLENQR